MTQALFPHQQEAVEFLEARDGRAGLFMKMRSGKTRAVLTYLDGRAQRPQWSG